MNQCLCKEFQAVCIRLAFFSDLFPRFLRSPHFFSDLCVVVRLRVTLRGECSASSDYSWHQLGAPRRLLMTLLRKGRRTPRLVDEEL